MASIAWRGVLVMDVPSGPAAGTAFEPESESEFEFAGERISRIVDRSRAGDLASVQGFALGHVLQVSEYGIEIGVGQRLGVEPLHLRLWPLPQ